MRRERGLRGPASAAANWLASRSWADRMFFRLRARRARGPRSRAAVPTWGSRARRDYRAGGADPEFPWPAPLPAEAFYSDLGWW